MGPFPCTIKPTMHTTIFTRDVLLAALAGFQLDKQRIDSQIAEVQAMLDGGGSPVTGPSAAEETPEKGRRKKFSAASRRRMAEAQKARWAKIKSESEPPSPAAPEASAPSKAKRKISAEGMKRIIAATKKRWRLQKAAAKAGSAGKGAPRKAGAKKAAPVKVAKSVAPVKKTSARKAALPAAVVPAVV